MQFNASVLALASCSQEIYVKLQFVKEIVTETYLIMRTVHMATWHANH